MIDKLPDEVWKPFHFSGHKFLTKKYAISSKGRIASYSEDVFQDGKLLIGSINTGYKTLNLRRPGHTGTIYIHRQVAKVFHHKPYSKQKYVIHLNHDRLDNDASNLKWASVREWSAHQQNSPKKIAYKKLQATRNHNRKLTIIQVKAIKKMLTSKKRTVTIHQIAKEHGVCDMTIYRIISGETWRGVK